MHDTTEYQRSVGVPIYSAFGARHVKGVAISRWVAAACFVVAAMLMLAFGPWWAALLFFMAAGLNGSLAYLATRWNSRRDAPTTAERSV